MMAQLPLTVVAMFHASRRDRVGETFTIGRQMSNSADASYDPVLLQRLRVKYTLKGFPSTLRCDTGIRAKD
jgi:hypothetical protein